MAAADSLRVKFAHPLGRALFNASARFARAELPLRASVFIFAGFVFCVIFGGFAINAIHQRDLTVAETRRDASNLADSLAQQAGDTFEALDGTLLALAERVESDGRDPAERIRLRESMASLVVTMPRLHGVLVIDARGRLIASNSSESDRPDVNFARRPYFVYHRTHSSSAVRISGPERAELEDASVINMSRRLNTPDGRFAGVMVAQIAVDYFQKIYASVDIGRNGAIALIADDGTLVVRHPRSATLHKYLSLPFFDDPAFRYEIAGSFVSASPIDGVMRLAAFRRLDRYPLVISVSLAQDEYLARWYSDTWTAAAVLVLVALVIAALAHGLSKQIGRRKQAEEALARMALLDGLTVIANRRHFDAVLEREWRIASRDRSPLALLVIDVDNFKAYNDRYGHQAGDAVLTTIAQTIERVLVRPRDAAARYGGEEFTVILPATDVGNALRVAERIRLAVLALAIPHAGSAAGMMSVSIGVAGAAPVSFADRTALVEAADAALYEAKRSGRNRSYLNCTASSAAQSAKSIVMPESA